jgi:hypothetical protein
MLYIKFKLINAFLKGGKFMFLTIHIIVLKLDFIKKNPLKVVLYLFFRIFEGSHEKKHYFSIHNVTITSLL